MKKTKVLAFCLKQIPSATVGVMAPLFHLKEEGNIDFLFRETLDIKEKDIAWADVVICIRGCEKIEHRIMQESRRLGKYLIYFLDDDLLNIPETSNSFQYFNMTHIRENIFNIMRICDCLWTTNPNILNKYRSFFDKAVVIHAPAMLLGELPEFVPRNEIKIGFAGSIDHEPFLESFLGKVIKEVLQKNSSRVKFQFFGAKPKFPDFGRAIEYLPYANNHEKYAEVMKSLRWDIGLAPLPSSEFHACKYFNKFLEYAAVGAAGIYSNVEPYTFIVKHKINGLLVDNEVKAWVEAIQSLIDDAELRQKIRNASYQELVNSFTVGHISHKIKQSLSEVVTYNAPLCHEDQVNFPKEVSNLYFYKAMELFKHHGFKAFGIGLKKMINKIKKRQ